MRAVGTRVAAGSAADMIMESEGRVFPMERVA
jgi:hypothetical protein